MARPSDCVPSETVTRPYDAGHPRGAAENSVSRASFGSVWECQRFVEGDDAREREGPGTRPRSRRTRNRSSSVDSAGAPGVEANRSLDRGSRCAKKEPEGVGRIQTSVVSSSAVGEDAGNACRSTRARRLSWNGSTGHVYRSCLPCADDVSSCKTEKITIGLHKHASGACM